MLMLRECSEPGTENRCCCFGKMNRHAALVNPNDKINIEGSGKAEWFGRTKPNNSLNASGFSMDVMRKVGCRSQFFPPR